MEFRTKKSSKWAESQKKKKIKDRKTERINSLNG